ncbi:beta-galactosidase [uncultured Maritalea sp.]|uniref:beta-galactosidase n=1 Tax=uncultured Maritalea sp. TaxID=757249 RepID=UPI00261C408A|nr:beta-galactosidase [uncultured Maritalea sp.]
MVELGVCYYPEQWSKEVWKDDAKRMVDLGIRYVRIAEFSWALVEPKDDHFDWQWLDEVIEILGTAGLDVVMCTPTAAPPKWLVDKFPAILPVDKDGNPRKFGARRHYCFSSVDLLREAKRITKLFAERYGKNPYVKAWQIDNEYGDHNTIYSFSDDATHAFRNWLQKKYGTIDKLNEAWGNTFWSMRYNSFEEIDTQRNMLCMTTPSHEVDYIEFSSDQVCAFNKAQVDIVRALSPNRPTTHNFMGHNPDFDHYKVGEDLDFASWDSYPMGALINANISDDQKRKMLRTGLPDQPAFNNELYRTVGRGNVWIMEQQPGPVNWARHNQSPEDGMVRLWTWLAYAHGVDVVCYFRWRQAKFAQEQYHAALLLPNGKPDQAFFEVEKIAQERKALPATKKQQAPVAIIYDYKSRWGARALPQGKGYDPASHAFEWYSTLCKLGVDADVVGPHVDFTNYQAVFVPDMMIDNLDFVEKLKQSKTKVVLGPRCGSKTDEMHIPDQLPPGHFQQLIDVEVTRVESLPEYADDPIEFDGKTYRADGWRESLSTHETALAHFTSKYRHGSPAIIGNDKCRYVATQLYGNFLMHFMQDCLTWAEVASLGDIGDLRFVKRGKLTFVFNFGDDTREVEVPPNADILLGQKNIPPADLLVWEE